MHLLRFSLALLFLSASVVAVDNRQNVKFVGSASLFCQRWSQACKAYRTHDSSLSYQESYCKLGNYFNKHTSDEAKVYCAFASHHPHRTTSRSMTITVTRDVAAAIGANFVEPSDWRTRLGVLGQLLKRQVKKEI